MKYRMLSPEELEIFENELKQFLIVNHVYKEEWEEMNASAPEKARKLVELFSDNVLQTVYERIRFLERRTPESCFVFHCLPEKIELIAIQAKPGHAAEIDLSTPDSIHEAMRNKSHLLTFFRHEKSYSEVREQEIHRMLEQGCVPSSPEFWDALQQV